VYNLLWIIIIIEVLNERYKVLRYVEIYRLLVRKQRGRKHIGRPTHGWKIILKLI
jgi:hypothetical protein